MGFCSGNAICHQCVTTSCDFEELLGDLQCKVSKSVIIDGDVNSINLKCLFVVPIQS